MLIRYFAIKCDKQIYLSSNTPKAVSYNDVEYYHRFFTVTLQSPMKPSAHS